AAGAARLLGSRRPLLGVLATAALWVATELLRGRIFQQPWVLLGYSQHAHVALIQISALTGVYGVSFLLALGNAAIAEAVMWGGAAAAVSVAGSARRVSASPLVPAGGSAGARSGGRPLPPRPGLVAVVQTDVAPAVHWTRAFTDYQVMDHTRLTDELVPMRDV